MWDTCSTYIYIAGKHQAPPERCYTRAKKVLHKREKGATQERERCYTRGREVLHKREKGGTLEQEVVHKRERGATQN